jgi:hypothetical protein
MNGGLKLRADNPYGYKATFNPTFSIGRDRKHFWISKWHVGLNQGPIVMMIENYRSGRVWDLMRKCPYLIRGLQRAGFTGGWLSRLDRKQS